MRQVYLDYSATTPVKEDVVKEMLPYYTKFYGNPSSLYDMGLEAKAGIDKARERVAKLINADSREIFFTSCGTEADAFPCAVNGVFHSGIACYPHFHDARGAYLIACISSFNRNPSFLSGGSFRRAVHKLR